ncbi:MAG: PEP/pyruvate-binding domain-containing protein [Syntrophobacteraceae bacterium]
MDKNGLPPAGEVEKASVGRWSKLGARLLRGLLFFLDAIGLWEDRSIDHQAQLARLRLYHTEFRKLLSANNSFLEMLGDLERKRLGQEFFDACYIQRRIVRAIADIHAMVESLNGISGERYPVLRDRLESISATLTSTVEETSCSLDSRLVIELGEISRIHSDMVGGKMANLGALRNELSLPAPDGLTVTTEGYRLLIEYGGLRSWIQDKHMELLPAQNYSELSSTVQEQILRLPVPIELEREILDGFDRLCARNPGVVAVAVRSSAVGEDSEFSFAGQYLSLLNVHRKELCSAYLQVAASLYSPEAVYYRALHGISGDSAEMAVGILTMIDAQSSGTVFSRDPADPDSGKILIQAVKGLGLPLVDGRVTPEIVLVPRSKGQLELSRRASAQSIRTRLADGPGVQEEALSPEEALKPCVSDDDAYELARWALLLEEHFGSHQDIEWAITREQKLMILQARPLRLPSNRVCVREPLPGAVVLLSGGEVACPGVGFGTAVHMDAKEDLESFPAGAVLVARRSSPSFIRVMSKAKAIITDVGSTTGHMASLALGVRGACIAECWAGHFRDP